jgi:hypothetical protein
MVLLVLLVMRSVVQATMVLSEDFIYWSTHMKVTGQCDGYRLSLLYVDTCDKDRRGYGTSHQCLKVDGSPRRKLSAYG